MYWNRRSECVYKPLTCMSLIWRNQKSMYLKRLTGKNGLFYINFFKLNLDSFAIFRQSPQWGTLTTAFKSNDNNTVCSLYFECPIFITYKFVCLEYHRVKPHSSCVHTREDHFIGRVFEVGITLLKELGLSEMRFNSSQFLVIILFPRESSTNRVPKCLNLSLGEL